ncbi:MAG: hypothetical protein COT17_04130 [Elusimicrobia bacterium CG08_land_8_20_14_0_20_51_18]|nr:MAG: hypothetical protein COT17_04130 [Elusimicrobia bacterium CG08_land_8_20_14_0_20_51_18]
MNAAPATGKGRKTRERLVGAAARVFARKGCAVSGIADICSEAGLAVGGFYRYFSSKEEITVAIAEDLRKAVIKEISSLPSSENALEEAKASAAAFFSALEGRLALFKAVREAESANESLARLFYEPMAEAFASRLAPFAGKRDAGIRAWAFLGALYFYAVKFLVWDKSKAPPGACEAAAGLCVFGISPRPFVWPELPEGAAGNESVRQGGEGRLLAAAEEIFGRRGYGGAHVSEIAGKAGFAAGSFYLFFSSKSDALEKVVLYLRDCLTGKAARYSSASKSRFETEIMSFRALFDFIREHPYGYRIMREAEFAGEGLADAYYGHIFRNYSARLKKTATRGEFSIGDSRLLALGLMGAGHMIGMKKILWGSFPGVTEREILKTVFGKI